MADNVGLVPAVSTSGLAQNRTAHGPIRVGLVTTSLVAALVGLPAIGHSAPPPGPPGKPEFQAIIRTTSVGVPHVKAKDYAGAGYGVGYAFAGGHACTMSSHWVRLSAERSMHFGASSANLASDFFWQKMIDDDFVGQMLANDSPTGVLPEVRELVRGYVAGYNRYLEEVGFEIPDPRCVGAPWIRPITERDVYHHALHWDILSFMTGEFGSLAAAVPPASAQAAAAADLPDAPPQPLPISASNMIALGSEATTSGNGIVFANPHWQWATEVSFFDAHITIPGEIDVNGMTPNGLPTVAIGHNARVGWSHTASTSTRFARYRLALREGSPTTYIVDGVEHEMVPTTVTVNTPAGPVSHTFYETLYGWVSVAGPRPWTTENAFTFKPATLNVAGMNMWLLYGKAESVHDIHAANRATLGMQWINVVAADANAKTYYAMPNAVPNLTSQQLTGCSVGGGVLDGSRSECNFTLDPSAPYEGVIPPDRMPFVFRDDYVQNSNNSHWLTNPREPMEGFSTLFGPERTVQGDRTRQGLSFIEARLAGTDGLPGNTFSLEQLLQKTVDGRHSVGRLWQEDLVAFCWNLVRDDPGAPPQLPEACQILQSWGTTDELDDPGAVLYRRFDERNGRAASRYAVPFDPDDPFNTPNGLNPDATARNALYGAINDLISNGIPLDATLRNYQYRLAAGERIPVPGGPQIYKNLGLSGFQGSDGWVASSGNSFIMWVEFTPDGPVGKQILVPGQSSNPTSPHFTDQTWLYSEGVYRDILFTEAQITSDPELKVRVLRSPPPGCDRANPRARPCP